MIVVKCSRDFKLSLVFRFDLFRRGFVLFRFGFRFRFGFEKPSLIPPPCIPLNIVQTERFNIFLYCNQAHIRRGRSAANCLVALTSDGRGIGGRGFGDLEGFFGRSSVSQSGRPQAGRANHVVCNPCDTNYLAVACGDLFARVFDRR